MEHRSPTADGARAAVPDDRYHCVKALGDLLKLLSNPDRLLIVQALADGQKMSVSAVAAEVGIPPARASAHLSLLRAHRLVSRSSKGQLRVYQLTMHELADWLTRGLGFIPANVIP